MAFYPIPPDRRIAYDRDDTSVLWWETHVSGVNEMTTARIAILNGEVDTLVDVLTATISAPDVVYVAYLFTQAIQLLDARFIYHPLTGTLTVDCERSDDSTNGRDGTWTQEAAAITASEETGGVRPEYRQSIASIGAAAAHTGWRFKLTPSQTIGDIDLHIIHLYASEHGPTDRLQFTHPTLDQELTPDLDFGDIPRLGSVDLTFRVKNLSALTANNIDLVSQLGTSFDGGQAAYTLLSTDGIDYFTTINIGNLAPGAISGLLHMRTQPLVASILSTLSIRITPNVIGGYT